MTSARGWPDARVMPNVDKDLGPLTVGPVSRLLHTLGKMTGAELAALWLHPAQLPPRAAGAG